MAEQKPSGPDGVNCAHYGGRPCSEVCRTCMQWIPMPVMEAGAQIPIERWGCALNWIAQNQYQTMGASHLVAASFDKLANLIVDSVRLVDMAMHPETPRVVLDEQRQLLLEKLDA